MSHCFLLHFLAPKTEINGKHSPSISSVITSCMS
uniref:Uncharacterized protein n=1 Tax=Arundo donax TaxID=35708 RepID=A0A0A8Y2L7_ARUDO